MKYLKGKRSPKGDVNFGFNNGILEVSTSPIINTVVYEVEFVKQTKGKIPTRLYNVIKVASHTTVECCTRSKTITIQNYNCPQNADVAQKLLREKVMPFTLQDITVISTSPYEATLQIKGHIVKCSLFPSTEITNIEWDNGIATVTTTKTSTLTVDNEIIVTVPQGSKTHTVSCAKDEIGRITVNKDYVYLLPRYNTDNTNIGGVFYEDAD